MIGVSPLAVRALRTNGQRSLVLWAAAERYYATHQSAIRKLLMQFAITALDYTDEDAINRRLNCRDAHIAGLRALAASGNLISAGAILDASGKMIGTSAHLAFADRAALDAYLQHDPYTTGRVWDQVDVRPVRLFDAS